MPNGCVYIYTIYISLISSDLSILAFFFLVYTFLTFSFWLDGPQWNKVFLPILCYPSLCWCYSCMVWTPPPLCKGGIRFFKNGCNVGRGVAIFTGNGREPGMEGVGGVGFIMGRDGKFLKSVYIVSRGVLSAYFMKTPLYCLSPPPLSSHLQMNETHTHTTQHTHNTTSTHTPNSQRKITLEGVSFF